MLHNTQKRQYLFGSLFILFGVYQLTTSDYLEFALYASAGSAFIINALTAEPSLASYNRVLVIVDWFFIILASVLFFYLLRYRFF
jgi:hypothetical protein